MKKNILISVSLVLIAVISRLISHEWNFTAMGAVAVAAGFLISNPILTLTTVLSALLISDAFILFHNTMLLVYLGYVLMAFVGIFMAANKKISRVGASAFMGSIVFFVVSNLGVWFENQLYPRTLSGLVTCFEMALPFFKNELLSTFILAPALVYAGLKLEKLMLNGLTSRQP